MVLSGRRLPSEAENVAALPRLAALMIEGEDGVPVDEDQLKKMGLNPELLNQLHLIGCKPSPAAIDFISTFHRLTCV